MFSLYDNDKIDFEFDFYYGAHFGFALWRLYAFLLSRKEGYESLKQLDIVNIVILLEKLRKKSLIGFNSERSKY